MITYSEKAIQYVASLSLNILFAGISGEKENISNKRSINVNDFHDHALDRAHDDHRLVHGRHDFHGEVHHECSYVVAQGDLREDGEPHSHVLYEFQSNFPFSWLSFGFYLTKKCN